MMSEKFLHAYTGSVRPQALAFSFPAANKKKVLQNLTSRGEIDKYIIVDEEEEARMKAQQAAILAKFAAPTPLSERKDVSVQEDIKQVPAKPKRKR